jgi:nitrogenase molybdenum-iron protein alpha chain
MFEDKYISPEEVKQEILDKYPAKVARKRAKQLIINKVENGSDVPEIQSNVRTIPGIITQRGCCYAGCKGVVIGPTRDILQITHGPIGCGYYSWLTRRNQTKVKNPDDDNFMTYSLSTDMHEDEIIFGGEKKLKQAIQEAYDIFKPKAISIFSTCPVGLIGDDVHAVAREMTEKLGINVFGMSCEGYKGVSQSAGHHIANNAVFKHVVGTKAYDGDGKYKLNLLGEYNIGGDAFEIERIFKECNITLISTFSGNSTQVEMAQSPAADLNIVMCHRSINYMADMMEKKYGIPWFKVNFIGAGATSKSLRKIAEYFGEKGLTDSIEKLITSEMIEVEKVKNEIYPRLEGKTVLMYVGGSRAHHYQELFKEIGMKVISAGYEFAHRDDYEGRKVLPNLKVDPDSRNIEELEVNADPDNYRPRKNSEEIKRITDAGIKLSEYEGMMVEMEDGSIVIDDVNHFESETLLDLYKPDLFCAGIKEKYVIQKHGIPLKQLHSYDYGGPYAGFKGAINFYWEIDRLVNSKIWKSLKAPWQENPELVANYVWE